MILAIHFYRNLFSENNIKNLYTGSKSKKSQEPPLNSCSFQDVEKTLQMENCYEYCDSAHYKKN